jgi:hypothetical protein
MCSKIEVENKRLKTSPAVESTSCSAIEPVVKLKKIPFYEHLSVLLEPSILIPSSIGASEQIKCFVFNLTGQQAIDIEKNRVIEANNVDYKVQVLLRICLVDNTSEQNDLYPLNFQLRVNNRICPLPPFLPSRPNTTPKRSSKPLNITPFVKISPISSNSKDMYFTHHVESLTHCIHLSVIEVRWHRELNKKFAVSCFLVRKLSSRKH